MTRSEFNRWWADLLVRFPNLDAWIVRTAANQETLLKTWAQVLSDTPIDDALDVNRRMQSGDFDFVEDFHEQDIPKHVRSLARRVGAEIRRYDEPVIERGPSSFPAGKILTRIFELTDQGIPSEEAKAIVLAEIPVGRPKYEHRFRCGQCLDSHAILVASNDAIVAMLTDRFDTCHHREAVVRCVCKSYVQQGRRKIAMYDESLCFRILDSAWKPPEVSRFRDWCEAKRRQAFDSRVPEQREF